MDATYSAEERSYKNRNKDKKMSGQTIVRGGCQMLCSAVREGLSCLDGSRYWGRVVEGQITEQEGGILSAVRGKKENTSPVLLKGSFISRS